MSTTTIPNSIRIALVALGLPNALAGLWAVAAPEQWFERFPGWDPRLVAAEPPYNAHLATDAGAGLLASGAVLLASAWLADRRSILLGIVAFAAFAVPHAAYHTFHPAPQLSAAQDAQNAVVLLATVAVAAGLFVVTWRRSRPVPERVPESPRSEGAPVAAR